MRKKIFLCCLSLLLLFLSGCESKRVKINAEDYIQLGQYKGLAVTRMSTEVSEEELEAQLNRMLDAYASLEPITDRKEVEDGDVANIDYEGSIDGQVFEGGSAKGFDLQIGSGTFIPGFEEGLIGAAVGDTVDVAVTFPNEYTNNPTLAGKDAVFKVTVNSISKKVLPELNEAFLKEKTGGRFGSVEEIRSYLKEQMTSYLTEYSDGSLNTQLLDQAVNNATLKQDLPAEFLEEKKQAMIGTAQANAKAYGKTYEEYLQSYLRMDEQTFLQTVDSSAEKIAKQSLVIRAIAGAEQLSVTDEELDEKIKSLMQEYGYEKKKELLKTVNEDEIRDNLLKEKVEDLLMDNAVISTQE